MKKIKVLLGLFFISIALYMVSFLCFHYIQETNIESNNMLNNKISVMKDLNNMKINTKDTINNIIGIDFDSVIVLTASIDKFQLKELLKNIDNPYRCFVPDENQILLVFINNNSIVCCVSSLDIVNNKYKYCLNLDNSIFKYTNRILNNISLSKNKYNYIYDVITISYI